jgi:thymidylate synthase
MSDGFPVLTTKKMYFKGIVTELIWFLRGDTNIKYLVDNDCNIWTGDAYKKYIMLPKELSEVVSDSGKFNGRNLTQEEFINKIKTDDEFAKKWGELGKIYGRQWRRWKVYKYESGTGHLYSDVDSNGIKQHIDQIANLIHDLKTNPDSRRLMVSAWNPADLPNMVLPPCHYGFQVWTRELSDEERSIDTGLGLPYNITSYALLLTILGKMTNMIPEELIGNLGDTHIYSDHIDGLKEQLTREPYQLPTLKINSGNENWHLLELDEVLNTLDPSVTFKLENYQSHPTIKLPLSN